MADKTTLEQMLEHLVNDESAKAEKLFHEYVVENQEKFTKILSKKKSKTKKLTKHQKTKKQKTKKLMKHLKTKIRKKTKLTKRLMKTK